MAMQAGEAEHDGGEGGQRAPEQRQAKPPDGAALSDRKFDVELRVLRYFLAVVDTGSTCAAAEALNTAQPSLSRQIHQLEAELGAPLFEKSGSRLRLTDAGRKMVPLARDLVMRADDLRQQIRTLPAMSAPISIVAPLTTINDVVAPFLTTPEAAGLLALPREALPSEAFGVLAAGEADLAISSGPVPPRFESRMLMRPAIWAYFPTYHPWSGRRSIEAGELGRQPLILLDKQHASRRLFDEAVSDAGVSVVPRLVTNLPVVALAYAAAGLGIAVVSDEPRFGLRRLKISSRRAPLRIPMYAVWDPSRYSAPAVEHFVRVFASYCQREHAGV